MSDSLIIHRTSGGTDALLIRRSGGVDTLAIAHDPGSLSGTSCCCGSTSICFGDCDTGSGPPATVTVTFALDTCGNITCGTMCTDGVHGCQQGWNVVSGVAGAYTLDALVGSPCGWGGDFAIEIEYLTGATPGAACTVTRTYTNLNISASSGGSPGSCAVFAVIQSFDGSGGLVDQITIFNGGADGCSGSITNLQDCLNFFCDPPQECPPRPYGRGTCTLTV